MIEWDGDELHALSTTVAIILVLVLTQNASAMVSSQPPEASISGTIRCGGGCNSVGLNYGDPIQSGGSVLAQMTMALDPFTGQPRPDLPTTNTNTTFDASAHGHFELQVQPGIFDLYVHAVGYELTLFGSGINVTTGASRTIDAFVTVAATTTTSVIGTSTFTVAPVLPISGFPVESILLGLLLGLCALALHKRIAKRLRGIRP